MPLSTRHYRTAFVVILLAVTTLLSACSIWPKALSFSSEPKAEAVVPPPASLEPAVAVSALPTVTELPKLDETPAAKVIAEPVLAAAPKAEAAPKPLPKTGLAPGFYINVGLYAVPDNANTAYRKLEKAGLPVFSDVVTKAQGPQTRVRVGPYPTRAKATAATKKIKALKLDAVVFKH
jgi:DedD protein